MSRFSLSKIMNRDHLIKKEDKKSIIISTKPIRSEDFHGIRVNQEIINNRNLFRINSLIFRCSSYESTRRINKDNTRQVYSSFRVSKTKGFLKKPLIKLKYVRNNKNCINKELNELSIQKMKQN